MSTSPIINRFPLGLHWTTTDPFLFCAHHLDQYPRGFNLGADRSYLNNRKLGGDFEIRDGFRMYHGDPIPGFPVHPHKGFETITLVREGFVDHADSLGAAGRYSSGDAQWMTAGGGIQHSEMFPLIKEDEENPLEILQIWLNLPKDKKNVPANYEMFWNEQVPRLFIDKVIVEVIAGEFIETKPLAPPENSYASEKQSDIAIWLIEIQEGGEITLPKADCESNRMIYFYSGEELNCNSEKLAKSTGIQVKINASIILKNSHTKTAKVLVLQGKPLNEPVVQHGPFVMNTREEISQAIKEYQETQFGGWPWERRDMVHGNQPIRFGKHADGKIDKPSKS